MLESFEKLQSVIDNYNTALLPRDRNRISVDLQATITSEQLNSSRLLQSIASELKLFI